MRNLHITSPKGMNNPNRPQFSHSTGEGPKDTSGGRDMAKGYDCVYPAPTVAESARASKQNKSVGQKGSVQHG